MLDTVDAALGEIEQAVTSLREIESRADALGLLQAVYQNKYAPLPTRMRAAIAALPFETPKLAVTAIGPMSEGFAMQLEKAIARSGKTIEAQAIRAIETEPAPTLEPAATEGRLRRL